MRHLRASDLRALAQLATQATVGVTRMVEGVHQSIWRTLGAPAGETPGQTRGLTGLVYQTIQGVTQLVGKGLHTALTQLEPLLASPADAQADSPEREAVLAALNGVLGDRLQDSHNPLATSMHLRFQNEALNFEALPARADVNSKVLLLIHGLCMTDRSWQTPGADHGAALAETLNYTPLSLRYNSGLHISQNGHQLAAQLEQLVTHWPAPMEELTVVAHSMGGLLIRSAVYVAQQQGMRWPARLKNIVFLGTPHHGAPLERVGNWVDVLLASTPFSAPFAQLGQLRSAGITDLRYGHVLDVDWQGHDRFHRQPDCRQPVPLPEGVACFTVAATTSKQRSALADRLLGDGLVPLHSALGEHADPQRRLAFAQPSQFIAYRTSHLALLSSPAVTRQMVTWLTPQPLKLLSIAHN